MKRSAASGLLNALLAGILVLACAPPASAGLYHFQSLGRLHSYGGYGDTAMSGANDINEAGVVTGDSTPTPGYSGNMSVGFVWDPVNGTMLGLGPATMYGNGINSSGMIVGKQYTPDLKSEAFIYYEDRTVTGLGDLAGGNVESTAFGINDWGQVVGYGTTAAGAEAFIWDSAGGMRGLGFIGPAAGKYYSTAYGINNSGQIVGESSSPAGNQAVIWEVNGTKTALGDLAGGYFGSSARAINSAGYVVGESSSLASGGWNEPFLWSPKDGMTGLGTLPTPYAYSGGRAFDVNDWLVVVGIVDAGAFTWDRVHGMLSLQHQTDVDRNVWQIYQPMAINNAGQIVGVAFDHTRGVAEAFLLTPAASFTDTDADGYAVENGNDCNDADPAIHPAVVETAFDGVDQNCDGLDLTVAVTKATWSKSKQLLTVEATSGLGANAGLSVIVSTSVTSNAMLYSKRKWTFTATYPANPGTVTVAGGEGWVTKAVTTVR